MKKDYEIRKGLSERELKKRLENRGWVVWRSSLIGIEKKETYPNVIRKYSILTKLFEKHYPDKIEMLQYMNRVHHGMPDFLCFRNGEFKFVKCKLDYEQLRREQKICIGKLQGMGFTVEIHRLMSKNYRAKTTETLSNGQIQVTEQQLKINHSFTQRNK